MSPLNFGQATPGMYGRCGRHRRDLVRRAPATLAEQAATERVAADARQYLGGEPAASPIPRTSPRRRGDCPDCIAETAAAAVAYLNGGDAA